MADITISDLWSYYMKSGAGTSHSTVYVTKRGFSNERLWMAVDENGMLISPRSEGCEKMVLIKSRIDTQGRLDLSAPGQPPILIGHPENKPERKIIKARMHGKPPIDTIDAGEEAAVWLFNYLGRKCRMVRMDDSFKRQVDQVWGRPDDEVSLADGFGFLITSKQSLEALGIKDMRRFRPNIVLDAPGLKPFWEDAVARLQLGKIIVRPQKPCTRCKVPGIDPDTGIPDQSDGKTDTLSLLKTWRFGGVKGLMGTFFGQNASVDNEGIITRDAPVTILEYKDPHPALQTLKLHYAA